VRSMNNTRSSGLEMLKGRQIERASNVEVGIRLQHVSIAHSDFYVAIGAGFT
jgi:hypothetical protein